MKTTEEITLVAPCGLHCGDCGVYKVKDDPSLREIIDSCSANWNGDPCPGCRQIKGNCLGVDGTCETYACVTERGLDFCFECPEFPCAKLNPAAERANVLPHNIKVFNLCCIKEQGLVRWLEKAPVIKQKYFRGKMVLGKGPQLE